MIKRSWLSDCLFLWGRTIVEVERVIILKNILSSLSKHGERQRENTWIEDLTCKYVQFKSFYQFKLQNERFKLTTLHITKKLNSWSSF